MSFIDEAGHRYATSGPTSGDGLVRVTVDGETFSLAVEPAAPGIYRVCIGDRVETLHCVADGTTVHLFWRGRAYRLRRGAGRSGASGPTSDASLEAPMPGRVVQVAVAVGDTVTKGQPLVVIEAMKMENIVRAPREGRVAKVAVAVGARVAPGQPLIVLE
jgi:3-methylcrotonyl-CoA carboxylase alpha subunit